MPEKYKNPEKDPINPELKINQKEIITGPFKELIGTKFGEKIELTYYEVNGIKISEAEYELFKKEGMQSVIEGRRKFSKLKEEGEKGDPDLILLKMEMPTPSPKESSNPSTTDVPEIITENHLMEMPTPSPKIREENTFGTRKDYPTFD